MEFLNTSAVIGSLFEIEQILSKKFEKDLKIGLFSVVNTFWTLIIQSHVSA
jgi:hypothetical protein